MEFINFSDLLDKVIEKCFPQDDTNPMIQKEAIFVLTNMILTIVDRNLLYNLMTYKENAILGALT